MRQTGVAPALRKRYTFVTAVPDFRVRSFPLTNSIEQLLADLGIPVEECPTCETCNWDFTGSVDHGIQTVGCRTCGRRYEIMTHKKRVGYLARQVASAAERGGGDDFWDAWDALVIAVNEPSQSAERRVALVTTTGDYSKRDGHESSL